MARKPPVTLTHQEVSVIGRLFALHPEDWQHHAKFERHTPTDVRAKLVELELIPKPTKLALQEPGDTLAIAARVESVLDGYSGAYRVLAARHAITLLQRELPKRVRAQAE